MGSLLAHELQSVHICILFYFLTIEGRSSVMKSGFLSEQQLKYWSEHYKIPDHETAYLPEAVYVSIPPIKVSLLLVGAL